MSKLTPVFFIVFLPILALAQEIVEAKAISVTGTNAIPSVNNFYNKIEFKNQPHAALVFRPGESAELMFGMHENGRFYWGTGRNATKKDFYSMSLNGQTGELMPQSINLRGGTVVNGWRETPFRWRGHSLVFGTEKGVYAHNVLEVKPGGATQGELLAGIRLVHAVSPT